MSDIEPRGDALGQRDTAVPRSHNLVTVAEREFRAHWKQRAVLLLWMSVATLALAACGPSTTGHRTANGAASSATSSVLVGAPTATGPYTKNFNPFSPISAASSGFARYLIYEPLYQPNVIQGTEHPWLATSYAWSNGGKTLTLSLRKGVR